jgi:hypothetical protein
MKRAPALGKAVPFDLAKVAGIEPAISVLETDVFPLHYTDICVVLFRGKEGGALWLSQTTGSNKGAPHLPGHHP